MKYYTAENYDPTTSIGLSLSRARNVLLAEIDASLRDIEITSQQLGIIMALGRELAGTPFELSKMLDIDSGLMTRMLDKLEKQDVLLRVRSVDDRRSINLQLTRHGKHLVEQIAQRAPDVINARLKDFTAAEFREFQRLLAKFISA
ncbi:MarR family winged helix-turn-helix transcriptional regulator [Duganella violaceipulchra]|uniref:MarR family transcriptional regulator n=1 Tax=Duganella violaceipulchra TaxID=2849652 RepID=A0AA41HJF6_9BURK|nr:MarR family transcriptional regulator [Duganella violaceicalia]MBV6325639.1 MarR family transcriptional regulator [Duganella violaceicalia]MCP2012787.1 DNA-binding MarR family transcriptional regulator [Duganella violaceicalia]